ncbi:MAG: hypothetical protein Q9162_007458 [Coniocarpon cinnabarinum]
MSLVEGLHGKSKANPIRQIKDAVGNDYGRPRNVVGESRSAFTSHADAAFDVCFENILQGHANTGPLSRHVELDIDIGADAKDWSAIQAGERLKPTEAELRRIEEVMGEIVKEMDYLREREQMLRDTNESTNDRVKWFAFGTMATLIGLGVWQVVYLRAYFSHSRPSEALHTAQAHSEGHHQEDSKLSSPRGSRDTSSLPDHHAATDVRPSPHTRAVTASILPSGGVKTLSEPHKM